VLALTWDDGPDERTRELAAYLHDERVSATFFVVGAWIDGVSEEPGEGTRVLQTGYDVLHVLGDVAALGHRIGNHTKNHVLLTKATAKTIASQLRDNEKAIEAWAPSALHMFRAPGGAWSTSAAAVVDGDPELTKLIGPVHWDIDGKDWEGSLYCRSDHPEVECEHAAPGGRLRVKPSVVAQRYLAQVEARGHGIVLFHDRVGHVGSDYALHVAHLVVPELKARGYVFAAPVLRFSPFTAADAHVSMPATATLLPRATVEIFGEAVGDGRVDVADIDGDGRSDVCARLADGVWCALATADGHAKATRWSPDPDLANARSIRLGDINGDGRADLCARTREGLACALSNGRSFLSASVWQTEMGDVAGWPAERGAFWLVDVNHDQRADVCADGPSGPVCALAP
jgi:peptidoglycan/xylan/chitin deacetylase (PgdA/CDA1 family)